MKPKLNIIICSTRPGRVGPKIATWVEAAAKANGEFDVSLVDLATFDLPLLDEPDHPRLQKYQNETTKRWSESVKDAEAFIFVTPEYNYFPPASIVNAMQVIVAEWGRKPAAVVSYGGISGGLRAAQMLRHLMSSVNLHPIPQTVPVPLIMGNFFDEDGAFKPTQPMEDGAKTLLDELLFWAKSLNTARQAG
ncbi:NADPH-dependent FMN reductase [Pseudooceanicola sp. MF1-13]|uniref:NADPH-dependent FMN reductase n=1 Tax=Pseudooceanicola sp. MF1-13 TaxID=3379095 RepID=UPI003891AA74